MSKEIIGQQDNTETAIEGIDLQFFADDPAPAPTDSPTLLGEDPAPELDPKPADPEPKPESKVVLKPNVPVKEPEKKEPEVKEPDKKEPEKPEGAPEKYEFNLPEGIVLDEAINTEFKGLAKELNLSQENAQKLLDLEFKHLQNQTKAAAESWTKTTNDWAEQTKKDLGTGYQEELKYAAKFIDRIAGPELGKEVRKLLDDTKMGNHPALAKLFIAAGKAISEDTLEVGSSKEGGDQQNLGQIFYPNMKKG